MCQKWLFVAILYYVIRASVIIYPLLFRKFKRVENAINAVSNDKDDDADEFEYDPTIEYVQTGLFIVLILLLAYTFKDKKNLHIVRWLLVL